MMFCKKAAFRSLISNPSRSFVIYNYPFKDFNLNWHKKEEVIQSSALSDKVLQSLSLGHDYFKLLLAKQDFNTLSQITKPKLVEELKEFVNDVKMENLEIKLQKEEVSYTGVDCLLKYDQIFGVTYKEENLRKYEIQNLMEKTHFKKILFSPKGSIIKMSTLSSIIVVDVVFNTDVKVVVVDPNSNRVLYGKEGKAYEKCVVQFTSMNKFKDEPMILAYSDEILKTHSKDHIDHGWKISNVSGILDEHNYNNIFDK